MIIRDSERQHWMSADLLPEHLLSASICICPRVPDTWALRWAQTSEEECRNEAQLVGISAEKLDAVSDWATEAFAAGRVGWPFVFLHVADASKPPASA
jgi:hypothetical protein